MPEITPEGLTVYKGFELFHKRPDIFIGPKPWGPKLCAGLMEDIVHFGAMPATVDRIEDWWIILTQKDWLLYDGVVCLDPFSKGGPSPRGQNAMRNELLIAAYGTLALTAGRDGIHWVCENKSQASLPVEIEQLIANIGSGRLVAFKIDGE